MPLDEHLGRWLATHRHSGYEYTRISKWLYKTMVKDQYLVTKRFDRRKGRDNAFVEEEESEIPDHPHPCLVLTKDNIVFPLTEYNLTRPPPTREGQEKITADNNDQLWESKKEWAALTC